MNLVSLKEENTFWRQGFKYIAGIDEVGRGPLAGPLVCCAIVFKKDIKYIKGINDSKKLTKKKREYFFDIIFEKAFSISLCIVDETVIDRINIHQATLFGMRSCIELLEPKPEVVLVDGFSVDFTGPVISKKILQGDSKVMSIAAASIIAKVTRDNIMDLYHKKYPHYGFNKNSGYGTKFHREAISQFGISTIHRRSFKFSAV